MMEIKDLLTVFFAFFVLCNSGFAQSDDLLLLKTDGKVVIGDTTNFNTPDGYNLFVEHGILTEKVKVSVKNSADWSDDSFIKLPEISEVKTCIEQNSHLVNLPSADQLVKEGYDLQSMDAKLLEQIEWLWQYTIKLSEENEKLRNEIEAIKRGN